jgi:hypothetical protein
MATPSGPSPKPDPGPPGQPPPQKPQPAKKVIDVSLSSENARDIGAPKKPADEQKESA